MLIIIYFVPSLYADVVKDIDLFWQQRLYPVPGKVVRMPTL